MRADLFYLRQQFELLVLLRSIVEDLFRLGHLIRHGIFHSAVLGRLSNFPQRLPGILHFLVVLVEGSDDVLDGCVWMHLRPAFIGPL